MQYYLLLLLALVFMTLCTVGCNANPTTIVSVQQNTTNSTDDGKSEFCPAPNQDFRRQSKLVAFLLSFFVGNLGVDRFYLGYIWQGVVKLLIGIFLCGGLGIWWLIDWILILTDQLQSANGCLLRKDI